MWTRPRATIQQIVDSNPEYLVIALAGISGFSQALGRASSNGLGDGSEWIGTLLMAYIAGPISGIIYLYMGGALIRWTGSWIGGNSSSQNIRTAIAWSNVPVVWALPLWIPMLFLFGQDLFTTEGPDFESTPSLAFLWLGFWVIQSAIGVWSAVALMKCLGQVQGFSAWKAFGNTILAGLVLVIPVVIISLVVFGLTR